MILSDFLSRQETDKSDSHEIIPISFDMRAILNDRYYKVEEEKGRYLVQTQSQTKDSGIRVPEVHGTKKGIGLNLRPEWLVRKSQKLVEKSRIEKKGTDLPKTERKPSYRSNKHRTKKRDQKTQNRTGCRKYS